MNPTHCKHFNGDHHNKTCGAGVAYADVTPEPTRTQGLALRRPCRSRPFGHPNSSPAQLAEFAKRGTCAKFQLPTAEELTEFERHVQDYSRKCTNARLAIMEHLNSFPESRHFACPICATGTLRFSIASCNGHIHAQCTTKECVSWIE